MIRAAVLLSFASLFAAEPGFIRVHLNARDGNRTVDLPLEQYVAAVVGGEVGIFRSDEALKAMAVAARTFAVRMAGRHSTQGYDLCGTTHCQVLDLRAVNARVRSAVDATAGEMIWFDGKPALAVYSQDCGGRTEDAGVVWDGPPLPYLRSHSDPYCRRSGVSNWQWSTGGDQVIDVLRRSGLRVPPVLDRITVVKRTPTGRAGVVSLAGGGESVALSANTLRFALGRELGWNTMRSERWDVRGSGGQFFFQGSGSGHGAGMCQMGADQMGVEGHNYRDILAQYYPGAPVGLTGRGLRWTRLGGERVAVMTARPSRDGGVVAMADRITRALGLWPVIEVRVYPDIDSFRNATGEPGWVAAHTVGRRIHLQPLAGQAVERTLRHELLHVMVEDRAAAGLPLWFREGLVCFLEAGGKGGSTIRTPDDTGLRQTSDAARARRAYDDARLRVTDLVKRYGEPTVMDWLRRGLPYEVTRVTANQLPSRPTN